MNIPDSELASPTKTKRQTYLSDTLNLFFDPFATPVAEQELQDGTREPRLFSYIIDLIDPVLNKSVSQSLLEAQNGFVFGDPGSGKTTLKYILEAECRNTRRDTLAVTYELSHQFERPPTPDEHWRALAENLALDLFIQIIEKIDFYHNISAAQKSVLAQQTGLIRHRLKRTVKYILNEDLADTQNGVATLWTRHNRYPVRYIYPSSKINRLLADCRPTPADTFPADISGLALLHQGIAAAKTWGFEKLLVFVDGVDAGQKETAEMLAILDPLFKNLGGWQQHALYFYFFLTNALHPPIQEIPFDRLTYPPTRVSIKWNKNALLHLLHQRLWAAGSHEESFNSFAKPPLDLEDRLYRASQGLPRRLLEVTSALIDAHVEAHGSQFYITADDWLLMQQQWAQTHHAPLLPEGTSHVSPCTTLAPDYQPDLFVNRKDELTPLSDWLNTSDPKDYIRIIAAPPLYGKTWLLAHMCNNLPAQFTPLVFLPAHLETEAAIEQHLHKANQQHNCGMHYDTVSGALVSLRECIKAQGKRLVIFIDYTFPTRKPPDLQKFLSQLRTVNKTAKVVIATRDAKTASHWQSELNIIGRSDSEQSQYTIQLPLMTGDHFTLDCSKLNLDDELLTRLKQIAKHSPAEWDRDDVPTKLINEFRAAGMVKFIKGTSQYKIVDGWREFLKNDCKRNTS